MSDRQPPAGRLRIEGHSFAACCRDEREMESGVVADRHRDVGCDRQSKHGAVLLSSTSTECSVKANPADGRARLEAAHREFEQACRAVSSQLAANDDFSGRSGRGLRAIHGAPHLASWTADDGSVAHRDSNGLRRERAVEE